MSGEEEFDQHEFNAEIIEEFRARGGTVGGVFEGAPMALLTTTGARTGRRLTSPLVYLCDGDRYVVIASNNGADHHPAWYHNLVANPIVTLEVGEETFEARATPLTSGPERDRLYAAQAERRPDFARYAQQTSRVIPVVLLERIA